MDFFAAASKPPVEHITQIANSQILLQNFRGRKGYFSEQNILLLGLLFPITEGSNEGHLQVTPAPSSETYDRRPALFMRFSCSASKCGG